MASDLELRTKVGDTTPWPMTLKDTNGAVDLSSATSVKIYARLHGATTNKIDGATVVKDGDQGANPGVCTYSPTTNDVDTAGVYHVEVHVAWSSGKTSVFPSGVNQYGRLEIGEAFA